jgi:hypothetical protein
MDMLSNSHNSLLHLHRSWNILRGAVDIILENYKHMLKI